MSKFRKNKIGKTDESKEKYQKIIYKLSDLRVKVGYSMRELSLMLDHNPQFIKTIENQSVELKLRTFLGILEILHVSLMQFFSENNQKEDCLILEMLSSLSLESKAVIIAIIKKLISK